MKTAAVRLAGIVAALALGFHPVAAAQTSFQGMCRFFGTGSYDRPAGIVPHEATWSVEGTGICSGTLNGKPVQGPVRFEEVLVDDVAACITSHARGNGTLHFSQPVGDIEYRVFHDVGFERRMAGRRGGLAVGFLTAFVAPPPQPGVLQPAAQCATGRLRDFNFEMDFMTIRPFRD